MEGPVPGPVVAPNGAPDSEVESGVHWVELRVHGVSGTPPESMLETPRVVQVAGDAPKQFDRGRFFRPADENGNESQPTSGRVLEAYHWGRFTSGTWAQGLWLLIIPFGVVNTAFFALPRATNRWTRALRAVAGAALRVIGLGMTCLLVFSSVLAAMDLFAWQRMGAGDGGGRRWWLLVAALLPVGALLLFFLIGRSRQAGQNPAADARDESTDQTPIRPEDERPVSEFSAEDFFSGDPDAPALRRLHASGPLHMVAAVLAWPSAATGDGLANAVKWAAIGFLGLVALTVLFLGDPERRTGRNRWHRFAARASTIQAVIAIALLLGAGALVALQSGAVHRPGVVDDELPGVAETAFTLLLVVVAALILLFASSFLLALSTGEQQQPPTDSPAKRRAFGRFAGGMTAFLLGAVGTFLGVGFAAAFDFAVQYLLNGLTYFGVVDGESVTVTRILQRVSYAWGITVVVIVAMALWAVIRWFLRRRQFVAAAVAAFDLTAPTPDVLPPVWRSPVARAMYSARLKNALVPAFWVFAVVGTVLSAAAGMEQWQLTPNSGRDTSLLGRLSELNNERSGWLVTVGTVFLAVLSLGLVILGNSAVRKEAARRGVNVIWDVFAFWPRSVHPFVPPPYSQHVVAGLRRRISWHLGTLDDRTDPSPRPPASDLVIAAHSQGSLITVAALVWLTPEERARVGIVTFGSQLQQQFSRAFPAAVDRVVLNWIWAEFGGRWRNLYRDTDPIAGPALSWAHSSVTDPQNPQSEAFGKRDPAGDQGRARTPDTVVPETGRRVCGAEWRLLDPPRVGLAQLDPATFRLRGHSDYPADPDWSAAVGEVRPAH